MLNKFLYIVIGLFIGVLLPHLQNIFNAAVSGNWGMLMEELSVIRYPLAVLIPLIIFISLVLWRLDKRKERKDEEKTKQRREETKADL